MLPFDQREFFELFERYNDAIWPLQVLAYVLGLMAVLAILFRLRVAGPVCPGVLALLWGWTGVSYHWVFFSSINPIAPVFGALFVAQALMFAFAAIRSMPSFAAGTGLAVVAGWALVAYATVLYPLLNVWLGHSYPAGPSFGVTPCPLVVFTFGVFLLSQWRVPWIAFVIPCLWSIVGGSAAVLLDVTPDLAMPVAAALAVALNVRKPARQQSMAE